VIEARSAFEEYCEAIFELREDALDVIQARIAERLSVSRPAVSEMIRRMNAEGLVTVADGIALTDKGMALAERTVRRHRLAERFLTDVLGLSWADAHSEADRWEHVLSDNVEAAINRLLENPTTCPHGNPIPGSGYREKDLVAMSEIEVGAAFTVTRIPEELEFTPGLLEFLEGNDILPGRRGVVVAASPDGTMTVEIADRTIGIGAFAAGRILVTANATATASAD
jgi:DtxR family transcriptional regulator, Mn-dependent transcriptional regulator